MTVERAAEPATESDPWGIAPPAPEPTAAETAYHLPLLTNSGMVTFRRCQREYLLRYEMGVRPVEDALPFRGEIEELLHGITDEETREDAAASYREAKTGQELARIANKLRGLVASVEDVSNPNPQQNEEET